MQSSAMRAFLVACLVAGAAAALGRGAPGRIRAHALLQTWEAGAFKASGASQDTPITRVVGLLKEMQATLEKEMKEDEELYDKLACWCNNNEYEKGEATEASESKINQLNATIEELSAKSTRLSTEIKELEDEAAADKKSLSEATALREKQLKEFQGADLDSTQAIENLKAAIVVLSKHHEGSFPQLPVSFLATGQGKDEPWTEAHEASHSARGLEEFMQRNGFDDAMASATDTPTAQHFLQHDGARQASASSSWSVEDAAVVRVAMKSAAAFVQARHGAGYYPSYTAQSGSILGVLKQLKEEMEADLSEAQKLETSRAATFAELRTAKETEIANGEAMAEKKEDQLATTNNDLAEAKEDLTQEEASLSETQKFLANLKTTCAEADSNFEARKKARQLEITAVAETIAILMEDSARDTFSSTYSFIQTVADSHGHERKQAAAVLRRAVAKTRDPRLSVLATSVQLDAFTRVKKAIDDMVAMLKTQQEDEVKKSDWCKAELEQTEMTTAKTQDLKAELSTKEADLESAIQTLGDEITSAGSQISELQVNLQRATEDRVKENLEFQQTVADQTTTVEILKKALDRLAQYYDEESLLQRRQGAKAASGSTQTPPVPQAVYEPSKGASGVMQMIEKLIHEAKDMTADAQKAEAEAQAAYEQNVADTNASVSALQKEVATKTQTKAKTNKDKLQTQSDISDTVGELEGLSKYDSQLHAECDYLLQNFDVRQTARAQEIEALQQAKQILSGAASS